MIPFAEVTMIDISGVISILAILIIGAAIAAAFAMVATTRHCPRCNEILRPVKVYPLDGSMPAGSRWYCSRCKPTAYFAEADPGKGRMAPPED